MSIKHFLITLVASLFISHVLVVIFLMFGPLYVGGGLAIEKSGWWTIMLAAFIFWPIRVLVRRLEARKTPL